MKISEIRSGLEKSKYGQVIAYSIRKIGLVNLLHAMEDENYKKKHQENILEYMNWVLENKDVLDELRNTLADDRSKLVWDNIIQYRSTRSRKFLKGIVDTKQYFDSDIVRFTPEEVLVDCGAYTGDVFFEFIKRTNYKYAYLFEPDLKVLPYLKKRIYKYKEKVEIIQAGAFESKGTLLFDSTGIGTGNIINTDAGAIKVGEKIDVETIDSIVREKVTFIKMDIEGSELSALKGAKKTIQRDRPKLAVCIYHKKEDFIEIPKYIKQLVPEYKLYLRHYSDTPSETVLYAVI